MSSSFLQSPLENSLSADEVSPTVSAEVRRPETVCDGVICGEIICDRTGCDRTGCDRTGCNSNRKTANHTLRQREQEFRSIVEHCPDSIVRCDRQFRFLYVNPIIEKMTGTPSEMYLGKTSLEMGFPADIVQVWHDAMERVFITGEEQYTEYEVLLPEGKYAHYSRIVPELAADGSVASVLVFTRDITKLKQAQDALAKQSEREYSLRLIAQRIRETLDLDEILETAVTEIQRILQADRTLIVQLNSDRSGRAIKEAVRPEYRLNPQWDWAEAMRTDWAAIDGQKTAQIIPAAALEDGGERSAPEMPQTAETAAKSQIVAPIVQRQGGHSDQVWGLLVVHACSEKRTWHSEEANLLQQVADQLAIAIQQAELYREVQRLNANLEQQVQDRTADLQQALEFEMLVQRITDQVRDSLDEEQILGTVVRELGQGLQLECCDAGIYSADLTTCTIAHEFSPSLSPVQGTVLTLAEAHHHAIYPLLLQGQTLQFCDRIPSPLRPSCRHCTILACPILDDQRALGDIWLFRREPFSPSEVRLVQQVANHCAIALRQSRLYQAAQNQVRELERLNQLKDDFLSTVSHELRTPMSSIKMATQMLEVSLNRLGILTDETAPIQRYFNILQEQSQREIRLINDLLDLARLDAETEPIALTDVPLQFYIPHLVESFVERTHQQQQQLVIQIPENLPCLSTDLTDLERILSELLHNACKYTPCGGTITVLVQAGSSVQAGSLIQAGAAQGLEAIDIRISNSGVEIPPIECDRIFDKFYRIPNNDPWKHGGTGLGLALVKKLTERIGGKIRVESGDGQTAFILTLADRVT